MAIPTNDFRHQPPYQILPRAHRESDAQNRPFDLLRGQKPMVENWHLNGFLDVGQSTGPSKKKFVGGISLWEEIPNPDAEERLPETFYSTRYGLYFYNLQPGVKLRYYWCENIGDWFTIRIDGQVPARPPDIPAGKPFHTYWRVKIPKAIRARMTKIYYVEFRPERPWHYLWMNGPPFPQNLAAEELEALCSSGTRTLHPVNPGSIPGIESLVPTPDDLNGTSYAEGVVRNVSIYAAAGVGVSVSQNILVGDGGEFSKDDHINNCIEPVNFLMGGSTGHLSYKGPNESFRPLEQVSA